MPVALRTLRISPRVAVCATVAILAAVNVVDVRVAHAADALGPGTAVILVCIARLAGLSWAELGLGKGTWRRGVTWAAACVTLVALVVAVGAALPLTRSAFRDTRYQLNWPTALFHAFVLIPVGTVLLEEIAFRGVLWGLLKRLRGTATATIVSSALFGLWHVFPSLDLAASNEAIGGAVGRGRSAQLITVAATVVFTALSGVVFCELRRRSGSVLASAGLHWATNGLSVLAAAAVWTWGTS
jgi:uncharacterized protein